MRKLGTVCAEVDATKIIEDSDEYLVVPAIIAREGVYPYPEGKAFKPADELKQASFTAEGAWVVAEKHPDTLIVTQRKDIRGRVENVAWGEDISGIRANIRLYKKMNDPQFILAVKSGQRRDVSIGFFYDFDPTAGEWKGQRYDFVQRNLLVDHVAAGVPVGRCSSPYCGIAVDSLINKVDADAEGDRAKAKQEQEARSREYGIGVKEGGNVTKPSEFAGVPDDEFADPVNYRYPIDAAHVMAAWGYINQSDNREKGGYTAEEWSKMIDKVKAAMKRHGHEVSADAAKEISRARGLLGL